MMKNPFPNETIILKFLFINIIFSSFFAIPSLCGDQNTTSGINTNTHTSLIATCLVDNGVNNFTLFPKSSDQDTMAYYNFLNFSIQNLRFTESSVPKPLAIIIPESKEQLVKTVLCCRKGSWEIRVRCGGHSYEGTSSVATDGMPFVIIDLMNLNKVSIDLESQMAWVEGGATVGLTYYAISEVSKVHGFSAGSCPTVGIGGHISGGGFGLLSRKYGLAADNVVDALLVDADGRVLDRESMGEEVFWAIRGGGGGIWGIIYAWKIKLVKVPEIVTVFQTPRRGTKNHLVKLVEKWQNVAPKLCDDFYLSVALHASLPKRETDFAVSAVFTGFYLGPRVELVSALNKAFPELKITSVDCKEMSWIESVFYFSGISSTNLSISKLKDRYNPNKIFFKAKSDYVKTPISRTGIRIALDIIQKEPKGLVILDPYGGFMEKVDSESIAFPHRQGNLFCIQYNVAWEEKDEQEMKSQGYIEWIRGFYNSMSPYVSKAPRAAYVNYMDLDLGMMDDGMQMLMPNGYAAGRSADDYVEKARVWGEKYFLSNYNRLVRAKTLVDPLNVFRHQQGIPPMSHRYPMNNDRP